MSVPEECSDRLNILTKCQLSKSGVAGVISRGTGSLNSLSGLKSDRPKKGVVGTSQLEE